ncbi:MAG: ketoacyl-ACP synthase III [Candidatus Lindowbacteria bacterium]|nr:ketoacyl-ACP synthase III [Candidatus Lindowbacteria bacterium]
MNVTTRAKITGWGHYLPEKIVTNFDLEKMMNTTNEWIVQRSGIEQRHYAADNETPSDMALHASHKAMAMAGITADEIDIIIFATLSPEYYFPGSGVLLQDKLGISPRAAIDIRNQCSGFLYGLDAADAYIRSQKYKAALLIGGEVHSRFIDYSDEGRHVAVLFGDAAAAMVIQASDEPGIMDTVLYSQGEHAHELMLESPGSASNPGFDPSMFEEKKCYPQMNGKFVFKNAIKRLAQVTHDICEKCGTSIDDIDLFLYHQANLRINQMVARELKIPPEKCFNNIQNVGNTSAASVPLAFSQAAEQNLIQPGSKILMASFGSGFTWGAGIVKI